MCNEELQKLTQIDYELERLAKKIIDSKEFNESRSYQKQIEQLLTSIEDNILEIELMMEWDGDE